MPQKITPDMLKNKTVYDVKGNKAGVIVAVIREKYKQLALDFLEIEIDRKVPWGFRDKVKVRTGDAILQKDGTVKVKYTKEQLKIMSKEQELQKHPPTV